MRPPMNDHNTPPDSTAAETQSSLDDNNDRQTLVEIARLITAADASQAASELCAAPAAKKPAAGAGETPPLPALLLEVLPIGVALCRDGELIKANTNFALAFGYRSIDELRANGGLQTVLPDVAPMARDAVKPCIDRLTTMARSRSGRSFAIPVSVLDVAAEDSLRLLVLHPPAQGAVGAPASASADDALLRLGDALGDGLVLLDGNGRIQALSSGAKALFDQLAQAREGVLFESLLASADRVRFAAAAARTGAGGNEAGIVTMDVRLAERAAPDNAVELVLTHPPTRGGGTAALWVALRRLPPADARIEPPPSPAGEKDTVQARGDFLAKVSHEVRTPLNSIIGFAEMMKNERFGPIGNVKYQEYARDIHDSGVYALSLINDLLDLSKVEAGRFDLDFAAVDANEVIAEAVHVMQPQARGVRVVVRAALVDGLPMVLADRRSLKQILLNLLSNAIKFTSAGGQAIVSSHVEPEGAVRIRVRDTGVGMTQAEIVQALEPFRQLDTAPREQIGTGLGLPLTRALVQANRARFRIESDAGVGTRVDVVFPRERVAGVGPGR